MLTAMQPLTIGGIHFSEKTKICSEALKTGYNGHIDGQILISFKNGNYEV